MKKETFDLLVSKMKKYLIPICYNVSFSQLTTLGCGGKIKIAVYPQSVKNLKRTIALLRDLNVKFCIIGKGSNVLASDEFFDGVAVVTVKLVGVCVKGRRVKVLAGTSTVTLAKVLQNSGLSGGEFFACLPATVGGATACNAGCYGQDVSSVLTAVTVLRNGKTVTLPANKCGFVKRGSVFKNNADYVILSANFKFVKTDSNTVKDKITSMRRQKAASQPLNYRSAGCVLYHDKVAVSKLLDEAGLKGYKIGGAQISEKHAGFVLNVDKAESKDIYLIIEHMKNTLFFRYGVRAETEVCFVNFTKEK